MTTPNTPEETNYVYSDPFPCDHKENYLECETCKPKVIQETTIDEGFDITLSPYQEWRLHNGEGDVPKWFIEWTKRVRQKEREEMAVYFDKTNAILIKKLKKAERERACRVVEEYENKLITDYGRAWKVCKASKPSQHHEKCSWQSGVLCDCAGQDAFINTVSLIKDELKQVINLINNPQKDE